MSAISTPPSPLILELNAASPGAVGMTLAQGATVLATAKAAISQALTQSAAVAILVQCNGSTLASASVTVAPTNPPLPTMPGQTYPSDEWLAQLAPYLDASSFHDFNALAVANKYTIIFIGAQAGDYPTFAAAFSEAATLRAAGKNVCIQVRRGLTFTAAQMQTPALSVSGASPALPMILMATPDIQNPRPILECRLGVLNDKGVLANVIVAGLDFYDPLADPSNAQFAKATQSAQASGLYLVNPQAANHILIEDCRVQFMCTGIDVEAIGNSPMSTIIVWQCVIANNYGGRDGIYSQFIIDLCVVNCLFDHNGWIAPAGTWAGYAKNIFTHNLYLQEWTSQYVSSTYLSTNPQTRVIGLLSAEAAAEGIEQRSGGLLAGSLFLANPIAGFIGPSGGAAAIQNCVVDGGGGLFDLTIGGATMARGWGLFLNAVASATVSNILAINKPDAVSSGFAHGLQCINSDTNQNVPGNVTYGGLIANGWTGPSFQITSGTSGTLLFSDCDLPGYKANGVIATPVYADSTRSVARYAATLGIAGVTDAASLLKYAVANQRRGNWDARLTAPAINTWIQAGFTSVATGTA